jgi:hypothetical protein
MSDKPSLINADTSRVETRVLRGIIYAGLVALLLVFGARMFVFDEGSMDTDTPQQSTQAPAAVPRGELPSNDQTKRSSKPARPDLFGG